MLLKFSIIAFVLFTSQSLATALKCEDNDYKQAEGVGWYKFHTKAKNWLEASAVCTKEGAHLAIINSEKEHKVIIDMFNEEKDNIDNARRKDMAWLGGHKVFSKVKSEWMTIFNEPLSSTGYEKWSTVGCYGYPPEPNNWDGNEFCLSVFRTCDQGLNDEPCNNALAFVCEKLTTCQ